MAYLKSLVAEPVLELRSVFSWLSFFLLLYHLCILYVVKMYLVYSFQLFKGMSFQVGHTVFLILLFKTYFEIISDLQKSCQNYFLKKPLVYPSHCFLS